MDPNTIKLLVAFAPLIFLATGMLVGLHISYRLGLKKKEKIDEGVYDFVVYGERHYSKRSGAMVHTTTHYTDFRTSIYFADGRTCVIRGLHNMKYPTGTPIEMWRNGNGAYWIEVKNKLTSPNPPPS